MREGRDFALIFDFIKTVIHINAYLRDQTQWAGYGRSNDNEREEGLCSHIIELHVAT